MDHKRKQTENTESDSHAWRRKPRKFAPKSRLGCKTCKIRRVKCDLSQPSCSKCQSTGRTCDGYSEESLTLTTGTRSTGYQGEKPYSAESFDSNDHSITTSASQPRQWHGTYHCLTLQNLEPLMILPVTGPGQTDAVGFFEYISIKHLNEYHPCETWRETLMFFTQTVPSVRHAAIALALVQRSHLNRASVPDKAPLLHYNRAIQLLLNQEHDDSTETTAITLLVCYLFTCFDHLAGNYVQAMKHLRGGVELSRNIDKAMLKTLKGTYAGAELLGVHTLTSQVTRQIRRLDIQAVTFLVDWTPVDIQEKLASHQLLPSETAFQSLDQAADHLHTLVARVMTLRNTEEPMSPTASSLKDIILEQLERWSSLFENMLLQQGISCERDPDTHPNPVISLLRLQHTIAWTLLSAYGPGREMGYDNFLPQFEQCLALASNVAAAHERYSGSSIPTFTPEVGIVPVLYIIGVKCRHPVVRREVLRILRRQPMREAVWDSFVAATVVERVIELEESGNGTAEGGGLVQTMETIPVWRRIEDISWVQTPGRVDMRYTFCGREGEHIESLAV